MEHAKYMKVPMYFLLHKLLASIDAKILFATHVEHRGKNLFETGRQRVSPTSKANQRMTPCRIPIGMINSKRSPQERSCHPTSGEM